MKRVVLVPDLPQEQWHSMDRYALRLLDGLREEAPDLEVTTAGPIANLTSPSAGTVPISKVMGLPGSIAEARRYIDRYWGYGRKVKYLSGDLLHILDHSYGHLVGAIKGAPTVVTVHDLHPISTIATQATSIRARIRNQMLGKVLDSVKRADAWIVATNWLKDELGSWLGHSENISVIPYGVDAELFETTDEAVRSRTRNSWGATNDSVVVLHVGSVVRRKRFELVIETVHALRKTGIEVRLVQVGATLTPVQRDMIREKDLQQVFTAMGSVTEIHLREAYRGADVLLFPSSYEGFGLPVVEAMASGLPVVNSGAGALTEVSAQGALLVESDQAEDYAHAVRRIVQDQLFRNQLISRAKERAQDFKWSNTANLTAAVYRNLV